MTERIADPQAVCPFVALDEDRDHRAVGPDHRHRCFADSPAAPRALAHQSAYCLSGSFPSCPTFVDWARREAAPPARVDPPARSLRDAGPTRGAAGSPAGRSGSREGRSAGDWTAPPPWGTAAGASGAAAGGADAASPAQDPDHSGSTAFARPDDATFAPAEGAGGAVAGPRPAPDDTPAFLAGRPARTPSTRAWDDEEAWRPADDADLYPDEATPARVPVGAPRRMPVGYAPVTSAKGDRRATRSRRDRADASAPSWEEPRRLEAYPTLRSRVGVGVPRVAIYALVILLVGAGLFAAPFILRGLGEGGEEPSPTPSPTAPVAPSVEPSPLPEPTPEQVVYLVKSGDSLSTIAATHGLTVEDILAANPSITDPNRIAVGDRIVIPQPPPTEIVDGEATPAP